MWYVSLNYVPSIRSYLFPVLLTAFGIANTMAIVAALGCFSLIVVMAVVPETYRRTVEQLETGEAAPRSITTAGQRGPA